MLTKYIEQGSSSPLHNVPLTTKGMIDVAETTEPGATYLSLWKMGGVYMSVQSYTSPCFYVYENLQCKK